MHQTAQLDWIAHVSGLEKEAILASVSHSLDIWDFHLDDATVSAGDALLTDLDNAVNGLGKVGLSVHLDETTLHTLWATLFAFIRDIHAPQDLMTDEQWQVAKAVFDFLNEEPQVTPAP